MKAARGNGSKPEHPYVCIYASQVAMCIGANKHKKISEALETTWNRVSPSTFASATRRNGVKTDEEQAADIIRAHSEVKDLVDLTLRATCDSSDQVARSYDTVARELRSVPLAEDDRKLLDGVLKRNLYTGYGNMHEHRVLEYVRGQGIECAPDPVFYKRQQGTCSGEWGTVAWYVGGKIDAIDTDRSLLIEIKNRVNRLFYKVPFYEMVQVQTYLHLLDLDNGILVECLKTDPTVDASAGVASVGSVASAGNASVGRVASAGEASVGSVASAGEASVGEASVGGMLVNIIRVRRDRDLWDREIVPKLHGFIDFMARLLHDPVLQDRYLQSKRRSAMITAHVNNWIKFNSLQRR